MKSKIKGIVSEALGTMNPVALIECVVVSENPINLRLGDDSRMILPENALIIPERLTRHKRNVNIVGTNINTDMTTEGYTSHTHDVNSMEVTGAEIEFTDELKKGEKVMVAAVQGGQSFFIIDRVKG